MWLGGVHIDTDKNKINKNRSQRKKLKKKRKQDRNGKKRRQHISGERIRRVKNVKWKNYGEWKIRSIKKKCRAENKEKL